MKRSATLLLAACLLFAGGAAPASAQTFGSVALGITRPTGDFGDSYDPGYTLRGRAGLSLVLADVHAEAGWSRFAGGGSDIEVADADLYHVGVGGRLGLGLVFVGLNADYFFGDRDSGLGWVPEVGVSFLFAEAVLDARLDGDDRWIAARVGLRF